MIDSSKVKKVGALASMFAVAFFMQTVSAIRARIHDMGGQYYNVRAYGAVGNGTTDDWTAISAAIAATSTTGARVLFPSGNWRVGTHAITHAIRMESGAKFVINNGETLTLTNMEGTLDQHFTYAGTGTVAFASDASAYMKEFYPEWWGAKADNSTASLDGLYNASRALPSHSTIRLQPGTYIAGSTATKPCMWPQQDYIEIVGAGAENSIVQYTSSYHNSNLLGGCLFFGDQANGYATTRQHLYIHDFGIYDANTGSAFDVLGANPSCFTAIFVTDLTVDRMHFKDCKGNSAMYAAGKNLAQTDNGENFNVTNSIFQGTAAGGYIEFTAINSAGWGSGSLRNNSAVGVSQTAFGFNDGQTTSLPAGIRIEGNTADYLQRGNNNAECVRMGAGRGLYVVHNTCVNMTANQIGIGVGEETADVTKNKQYDLWITDNVVRFESFSSTLGMNFGTYTADQVHILRNNIRAAFGITADVRADADANGPGMKTVDVGDNIMDCGSTNCRLFNMTQSTGTVTLSTDTVMLVHNNVMSFAGSAAKLIDWAATATLKNQRVRLWDNQWLSNTLPRDTVMGMPTFASGIGTVSAGGTGSVNITYTGALPGDVVTIIQLTDGSSSQPIPAGVSIWGYSNTTDQVTIVVSNGTGSNFDPSSSFTPLFIGERKR